MDTPTDGPSEAPSPDEPEAPPPPAGPQRVAFAADGSARIVAAPPPAPPLWKRVPRRLLIVGAIVALVAGFGWWNGRGKTGAQDLEAGDCFELPGRGNISDVANQSCEGLHNTEILVVTSLAASDFYPGFADSIDLSSLTLALAIDPSNAPDTACAAAIEPLDLNLENIPADLSAGYFYPGRDAWDEGDRTLLCYASSRTGIPGPLVNR